MLRQTIITFSGKFFIALVNFLTVIITAHYLGAEGRGIISLFVLNLTIIAMVSSFIGGPGLVYLFPRHDSSKLFTVSYLWALLSSILVSYIMYVFSLIPPAYFIHLLILSLLQSVLRIQTSFLLSQQKIKEYNIVLIIYPVVLLVFLFYAFKIKGLHNVEQYFTAFYLGLGLSLVYNTYLIYKNLTFRFSSRMSNQFQHAFRLGIVIQGANIIQLMNYRFSYFLLDHYHGKESVGVYSTAISFAEVVWIIANSFATIQYARIANSKDDEKNKDFTLLIIKVVIVFTAVALLGLLVLPQSFFLWMLGKDFGGLMEIFPLLAPGIFIQLFAILISHYYSGSGKPKIGFFGSTAGFAVTLIAGFLLIPQYGLKGASVTATSSYIVSSILLLLIFKRQKKIPLTEFIPTFKNLSLIKKELIENK